MTDVSAGGRSAAQVAAATRRLVGALTLTKFGDRIVDPKTVLAWFLEVAGAPVALTGLLFLGLLLIPGSPAQLGTPSWIALGGWVLLGVVFYVMRLPASRQIDDEEMRRLVLGEHASGRPVDAP